MSPVRQESWPPADEDAQHLAYLEHAAAEGAGSLPEPQARFAAAADAAAQYDAAWCRYVDAWNRRAHLPPLDAVVVVLDNDHDRSGGARAVAAFLGSPASHVVTVHGETVIVLPVDGADPWWPAEAELQELATQLRQYADQRDLALRDAQDETRQHPVDGQYLAARHAVAPDRATNAPVIRRAACGRSHTGR